VNWHARSIIWGIVALLHSAAFNAQSAEGDPDPAANEPFVEVTISPGEVSVGDAITLGITVFSPTWFPKPPEFPSFELANTITRLPPNSSRPTTRRINGELWSGIVRNYEIYPLVAATYRLDKRSFPVTYADPETRKPSHAEVDVPAVEFKAHVPPGAEALSPYLAGKRLTLDRIIDGDLEDLQPGDAIVVRYSLELDHMPGIFLPSLAPVQKNSGMAAYPAEPVIEDGPPARRTEKVTYVFEAGGSYALPAVTLSWWNSERSEIAVAALPEVRLSVAGARSAQAGRNESPADWRRILLWLLLLALTGYGLYRVVPLLRIELQRRRQARLRSEAHAFKQLRRAIRSGNLRRLEDALSAWIERTAPDMDTVSFIEQFGDKKLSREIGQIKRLLYADRAGETPVDFKSLEQALRQARSQLRRAATRRQPTHLPQMNP